MVGVSRPGILPSAAFHGPASAFLNGILSFIAVIAIPCSLAAQDHLLPVFHFTRLSTGVSPGGMRSRVVRDDKGFVWLGTVNDLERYDGNSLKDYRNVPHDSHSLSSNTIMSLLADSKHRLWLGTFETGLSLFDEVNDRFVNFLPRHGDSLWLQSGTVWA